MGRTGRRMVKSCTQEKSSPGGEETGEGERHHQSIPCAYPPPIKAKTPVIVHDQGKSRQTMKKPNPTITSANGAASYQPRATLWVCTPHATSTESAPHPANQGKTPSNQGKSSLIKANAIFSNVAKRTHPLDGADRLAHGQIVYPGEILSWGRGNR